MIESASVAVGLGLVGIDLESQPVFGEVTRADQQAEAFAGGLELSGMLESVSSQANISTRGRLSADLMLKSSGATLYDLEVSLSFDGRTTGQVVLQEAGGAVATLFSFSGGGPLADRLFAEQVVLTPGVEYTLTVGLTSAIEEDESPASVTTSYALSLFAVPEPGALGLLAVGVGLVGVCGRRRERAA